MAKHGGNRTAATPAPALPAQRRWSGGHAGNFLIDQVAAGVGGVLPEARLALTTAKDSTTWVDITS